MANFYEQLEKFHSPSSISESYENTSSSDSGNENLVDDQRLKTFQPKKSDILRPLVHNNKARGVLYNPLKRKAPLANQIRVDTCLADSNNKENSTITTTTNNLGHIVSKTPSMTNNLALLSNSLKVKMSLEYF